MKTLIVLLSIIVGSAGADRYLQPDGTRGPKRTFPNELTISLWENHYYKSTPENYHKVVNQLRVLPHEPWPERLKVLLLDMINKHHINGKYRQLPKLGGCGEAYMVVTDMAAYQADVRFVPFLMEYLGMGGLTIPKSLAQIGKPAFQPVLKALYRNDLEFRPGAAAKTIDLMFEHNWPFLQDEVNQYLIRQGLLHVIGQEPYYFVKGQAVEALRHVGDKTVVELLTAMSLTDITQHEDGSFPVRMKAQQALQYIRRH